MHIWSVKKYNPKGIHKTSENIFFLANNIDKSTFLLSFFFPFIGGVFFGMLGEIILKEWRFDPSSVECTKSWVCRVTEGVMRSEARSIDWKREPLNISHEYFSKERFDE